MKFIPPLIATLLLIGTSALLHAMFEEGHQKDPHHSHSPQHPQTDDGSSASATSRETEPPAKQSAKDGSGNEMSPPPAGTEGSHHYRVLICASIPKSNGLRLQDSAIIT